MKYQKKSVTSKSPWSRQDVILRALWELCQASIFRLTPKPCYKFRAFLLKCFGAQIEYPIWISNSVKVAIPWKLAVGQYTAIGPDVILYNLDDLVIGERVVISQRAHLCCGTHEYHIVDLPMPLITKPIRVGALAWICAEAYIGPGTNVGEGGVVGARACVTKDVVSWTIVAGNPARYIRQRTITQKGDNTFVKD